MTADMSLVSTGSELPAVQAAFVTTRELLTNAAGLVLRRVKRDRTQVSAEYDRADWKNVLQERRWTRVASLRELVVPLSGGQRTAMIEGRYVRISDVDYYAYRCRALCDAIEGSVDSDTDEIVELGCGYGMNLFSLSLSGRWRKLIGCDISQNGIAAACAIAGHFGLENMSFQRLDATDRGAVARVLAGQTVYTYYCLEQLKYATPQVIANLLAANARRVIHIEPTVELLRFWRPRDVVNYLYIKRRDYQDNLLSTLRTFEKRGDLRILDVRRLGFAPSTRHDPTFVCWEPTQRGDR